MIACGSAARGRSWSCVEARRRFPGSIRVPRVGFGVPPKRTFEGVLSRWMILRLATRHGSSCRRDAGTNTRDAYAPRIPTRTFQPIRRVQHHRRIFPIRPSRANRRPAQRRRADVAPTPNRVPPSAIRFLMLREPEQPAANQIPMPLAIHRRQCHHRRRRGKRAARKLALPMSMRPHFRQQRLRRLHQSRPQSLR